MRLLSLTVLTLISLSAHSSFAQEAQALSARAQSYESFFFPKGAPDCYLDVKVARSIPGTRQLMTVLPGVLYRGGGPGGQRPLPDSALRNLCEAGFSLAVYAYDTGFSDPGPIACTNKLNGRPHTLTYVSGRANDAAFKRRFLSLVRAVAMNPSRGPVFVHCWNGHHASGELAAIALRQLCSWDGYRAGVYWERHSGGFPLISRIGKFEPVDSMALPSGARAELCQQRD